MTPLHPPTAPGYDIDRIALAELAFLDTADPTLGMPSMSRE